MGSYQRGTTIALEAWCKDIRSGNFVDPDSGTKELTIYKDGTLIKTVTDGEMSQLETGKWYYDWDTEDTLVKGLYVYQFSCKVGGKDAIDSAILRIRERKRG